MLPWVATRWDHHPASKPSIIDVTIVVDMGRRISTYYRVYWRVEARRTRRHRLSCPPLTVLSGRPLSLSIGLSILVNLLPRGDKLRPCCPFRTSAMVPKSGDIQSEKGDAHTPALVPSELSLSFITQHDTSRPPRTYATQVRH